MFWNYVMTEVKDIEMIITHISTGKLSFKKNLWKNNI